MKDYAVNKIGTIFKRQYGNVYYTDKGDWYVLIHDDGRVKGECNKHGFLTGRHTYLNGEKWDLFEAYSDARAWVLYNGGC